MLVAFARVLVRPGQASRTGQRAKAETLALCTSAALAELTGELRTLDARRGELSVDEFDAFHQMLAVASALIMLAVFLNSLRMRMGGSDFVGRCGPRMHSRGNPTPHMRRLNDGYQSAPPALRLMPGGYFDSG